MKLRPKFIFLSIGLVLTMIFLSLALFNVSNRIINLKNYNIDLAEAKYDVADISDFVNRVLFHEVKMDTLMDKWTFRLDRITADFNKLSKSDVLNLVPKEMSEKLSQLESFWMILSARFSSFNTHLKSVSDMN